MTNLNLRIRRMLALSASFGLAAMSLSAGLAAASCGLGLLAFETPLFIEEGKTLPFNVKYTGVGKSGTLSAKIESGPFSIPGGTCIGKSLNNGETCTVEVTCKGSAGETGKIRVHTESVFVGDAVAEPGCT